MNRTYKFSLQECVERKDWDDDELGSVRKLNLTTGVSEKLTPKKGNYRTPCFSPNGSQIVYVKAGGNDHQGYTFSKAAKNYVNDTDTLVNHILKEDKDVFKKLLTTEEYFVAHNGDNEAAKSLAAAHKKLYAYFKDKDWKNYSKNSKKKVPWKLLSQWKISKKDKRWNVEHSYSCSGRKSSLTFRSI